VLLGNGNGTFQAAQNLSVGAFPACVAVADVNRDGRPDILVTNAGDNTVSVLLGNGNSTFKAPQNFATGKAPFSLAVADLNGDGKPDLVTADYLGHELSVLLGNGNGTFRAAQNLAAGAYPSSVTVADVNGDGRPDLIAANFHDLGASDGLYVFLGNGNGTFKAARVLSTGPGTYPHAVVVADVNGDGRPDLITANWQKAGSVSVLLGNGNGSFKAAQTFNTGAGTYPNELAVADLNGDGKPDLVTADYGNYSTVGVLLGNGNGTFQSAVNFGVGGLPYSVAVADLNGDGRLDLATANASSNSVSVLLGKRNAATHLQVTAPASATAGTSFTVTVSALTAGNGIDCLYTGTVHFTSSDGSAGLPADYTFTKTDLGSHTFTVTLSTASPPPQTITVTDTVHGTIRGTATVSVSPTPPAPSPPGGRSGGRAAAAPASDSTTTGSPGRMSPAGKEGVVPLLNEASFLGIAPWVQPYTGTALAATRQTIPAAQTMSNTRAATGRVHIAAASESVLHWQSENDSIQGEMCLSAVETCFADDTLWQSGA
jgi:hypothetical protein